MSAPVGEVLLRCPACGELQYDPRPDSDGDPRGCRNCDWAGVCFYCGLRVVDTFSELQRPAVVAEHAPYCSEVCREEAEASAEGERLWELMNDR